MTREETLRLIRILDDAQGSEAEEEDIFDALEEAYPNAGIIDLLYHHRPHLSAEEVYEIAAQREEFFAEAKCAAAKTAQLHKALRLGPLPG